MKSRRKIRLKYKKERVLLSDVLPYELPIIMSNRALYRFCVRYKIHYNIITNTLHWDENIESDAFEVLKQIFKPALKNPLPISTDGIVNMSNYSTIPFVFHILHKESEFRALSVVHPAMQIGMVDFYHEYKHLILHYCDKSRYSLRYPHDVASFYYYKDKLHHKLLGTKKDNIELFFNEYENLKTFFSYKKYTQIYRFYDDYRFQRAEKRFSHLLRFDLQKCFDSIYTHTIAWATQGGKAVYKNSFANKDCSTFGGIFDTIMQRLNYNETSGIVIGPEFSRIFAEIILQHVDRSVEYAMENLSIRNGREYQLYRYVDDYFLFYNDERVKEQIIESFNRCLEDYRLKISREKTIAYDRPFITEISRAKIRIDELINDWFKFRTSKITKVEPEENSDDEKDFCDTDASVDDNEFSLDLAKLDNYLNLDGYFPLVSRKFNQAFKDAVLSVNVKAKDVLNYTLSCVATRVERELRRFDVRYRYIKLASVSNSELMTKELHDKCKEALSSLEKQLTRYLMDVIDSAFFLFSLNKRLNSALKLMRLLNSVIIFLNGVIRCKDKFECRRFDNHIRIQVFGQIHNEVINVLERSKCHEYAQLEVLYLLIIMRSIDDLYPISESVLIDNIGIDKGHINLNAIALNILLFYIGNKNSYVNLKTKLIENIKDTIRNKGLDSYCKDTECIYLMLDLACCPYIDKKSKGDILTEMQLSADEIAGILAFAERNKNFFTKWRGVNITKELAAKISQEVYS